MPLPVPLLHISPSVTYVPCKVAPLLPILNCMLRLPATLADVVTALEFLPPPRSLFTVPTVPEDDSLVVTDSMVVTPSESVSVIVVVVVNNSPL